MGYPQK